MEHTQTRRTWAAWLSHPVAVLAWAGALLIAGAWAAWTTPLEWVPQIEQPVVHIGAAWPGASARQVERYVTAPIERAVQRVPGTARVESLSEEGRATVTLSVSEAAELGLYVAQVNEQLALLRGTLPDRVAPRLTKQVPEALREAQGFVTLQLVGPATPDALRTLAEDHLAPRLRSLPGIADVRVAGGTQRELLITLASDRLGAHGLAPAAVYRSLHEATTDVTYGRLRTQSGARLLFSPAEDRTEALRRLVLSPPGTAPVRLADVATVQLGPAPRRSISRIDGQSVVTLTLSRAQASALLGVAASVHARLRALRLTLPPGTRLLVADDKSEAVRAQLRDLAWRGGLGLAFVILGLMLMLRSRPATLVVLFSVGVAVAVAFLLLRPLGLTLNLLTLAGLVLVFGLLVDNAVVMVEQMMVQRARHPSLGAAAEAALGAVWLPLVGGTLSTMAVMLPLVYLSGELRGLFLPFGLLVAMTMAASLASAVVLVPVLSRFLDAPTRAPTRARRRRWRWMEGPYRTAVRFPRLTLLTLFLILGVPVWLLPPTLDALPTDGPKARLMRLYNATLGTEAVQTVRAVLDPALGGVIRPFVRQIRFGAQGRYEARPEVSVSLRFPPGTPIEQADALIGRFEQTALASEAVHRTLVDVSEGAASMRVLFTDDALRSGASFDVRESLIHEAVLLAGISVSVDGLMPQGYHSGSGGGVSGVLVEAYGPNYEALDALCRAFAERLRRRSRRVAGVDLNAGRWGSHEGREVLRLRWTAEAAARTGIQAEDLAATLRPILSSRRPLLYAALDGEPRLPVRVSMGAAEDTEVTQLIERPLTFGDSTQVRLAGLAPLHLDAVPGGIERADQQYKRYLGIDFRGSPEMGRTIIGEELAAMPLPPGYRLQFSSLFFLTEAVGKALGWVLLATLVLVFLITAAVFESWRLPGVVMLSVPLAGVGMALGFLWTEAPFAEGAFIGIILLVGIAVNDSILLTDRFRQLRRLRPDTAPGRLARLAVRDRLRPMWTTTLTSILALLPLLVFPDAGAFWLGLAVTVTGGLLAATLLAPLASVALLSLPRRRPG